jgi:cysteinyl-tRNA synthetase
LGKVLGIIALEPEQWFRLAKPGRTAGIASEGVVFGHITDVTGEPISADLFAGGSAAISGAGAELTDADVEGLIAARIAARKAKDFAESDRIRDQLAAAGVIVEDKPGGKSTWRRA